MAKIDRGDTGQEHEARVVVCTPMPDRAMIDDVIIDCSTADNVAEWGFPVTIRLSRDEALELCSQLALRFKTPVFPKARRVLLGKSILAQGGLVGGRIK